MSFETNTHFGSLVKTHKIQVISRSETFEEMDQMPGSPDINAIRAVALQFGMTDDARGDPRVLVTQRSIMTSTSLPVPMALPISYPAGVTRTPQRDRTPRTRRNESEGRPLRTSIRPSNYALQDSQNDGQLWTGTSNET